MPDSSSLTLFMTGSTGFLGMFVLRELLTRGCRIAVLLRPPLRVTCDRLITGLDNLGFDLRPYLMRDQLIRVEGVLPDGLPDSTWGPTAQILHSAASLRLSSNGCGEPHRTNVEGTRALIEWADTHHVRTLHAVSTAYVCGWTTGPIAEVVHHPCPDFQTDYERTKWTAECDLADWAARPGNTLTLLRPSFLVGDSQTGYSSQFCGFYQLARLVSLLKERHADLGNGSGSACEIPLRIPGRPDDVHNLVPVDFAARMVAEVITNVRFHGRIYHLTNPQPPTNEYVKRCLEEYFNMQGGYFVEPGRLNGDRSDDEALMWNDLIQPRIGFSPVFHRENADEVMHSAGLTFPMLHQEQFSRLLDYASSQRWGRGVAPRSVAGIE